jgi:hypothetical protein
MLPFLSADPINHCTVERAVGKCSDTGGVVGGTSINGDDGGVKNGDGPTAVISSYSSADVVAVVVAVAKASSSTPPAIDWGERC